MKIEFSNRQGRRIMPLLVQALDLDHKNLMLHFSSKSSLVILMAWIALGSTVTAHPMGNFSVSHYTNISIGTGGVELLYIIDMAEVPTFQERPEIDLNNNGQIEPGEKAQYLSKKAESLTQGLVLRMNRTALKFEKVSEQLEILPGGLNLPTTKIKLRYRLALSPTLLAQVNTLDFQDNNFPGRVGWKEIVARPSEGVELIESSVPVTDKTEELSIYPQDPTVSPPQDLTATVRFKTQISGLAPSQNGEGLLFAQGAGSSPWQAQPSAQSFQQNDARTRHEQQRLTQLLSTSTVSLNIIFLALVVAFGLGAFHALSPGHGKTVVGAYLVGTRGTAKHAILLGGIVTITHTLGVFILGLVTLYASRYILPEKLYPWLGFFSGLAVVVIGLGLFLQRYRNLQIGSTAGHQHEHRHDPVHGHDHHHSHEQGHHEEHSHNHPHSLSVTPDHGHPHHDSSHTHAHDHHSHQQFHSHAHEHSHASLTHSHGGVTHTHDYTNVRLRDLLTLGVTGGIVPCPSALVVLLSAISINRVGLGLLMIVAFSIGLALVLMAIGLMMVYARSFMERVSGQGKLWRILPVFSSLIVAGLGAVIAVQALVSAGIVQIQLSGLK